MLNFIKLIQCYWFLMLNRLDWHLSNAAYKQHLACASSTFEPTDPQIHWETMDRLHEHIWSITDDALHLKQEIFRRKYDLRLGLIKILNTHIKF